MSTPIRPEISAKNIYSISKERYYELAHFCRQYGELQKMYAEINSSNVSTSKIASERVVSSQRYSSTEATALSAASIKSRIDIINRALLEVDEYIRESMKICVTEGISFSKINAKTPIPICKDYFYINYRKFFWFLDKFRE